VRDLRARAAHAARPRSTVSLRAGVRASGNSSTSTTRPTARSSRWNSSQVAVTYEPADSKRRATSGQLTTSHQAAR
jgi:hypothetical protein